MSDNNEFKEVIDGVDSTGPNENGRLSSDKCGNRRNRREHMKIHRFIDKEARWW